MALTQVKRTDFSNGLVHLTRERTKLDPDSFESIVTATPFEVLKEIVISGTINASGNSGYVKGTQKAVCFSEIPLSSVHQFASVPSEQNARYRFYGVSLSKKAVFAAGGRPVIYLPDNEGDWIPPEHKWRHVRFEFGSVDFTHEREWRCLGDFDLNKVPGLYLIVWSATEAREIASLKSPVQQLIRGVLPMEHLTQLL